MWILYLVIYSFLIGFYTIYRKKATERTNILFVLSLSSTIGFLLVSWSIVESFQISINNVLIIFVKALLISFGWIFELIALNKYYISSLQPISSIKVIITFIALTKISINLISIHYIIRFLKNPCFYCILIHYINFKIIITLLHVLLVQDKTKLRIKDIKLSPKIIRISDTSKT